jgi:hypothetical protein
MTNLKETLQAAKPEVGENRVAAFLLASITGIGTIISALGVSGSVVGRMVRNHPLLSGLAYGVALLAVLAGVFGLYRSVEKQRLWFNAGLILFAIAGLFALFAALAVWGDHTSPQIWAAAKPSTHGGSVDLTVKSSGLRNEQRLTVDIWPLESTSASALSETNSTTGAGPQLGYSTGVSPIYQSVTGPDANGNVNFSTSAHLPPDHPSRVVVEASTDETELDDCFENEKTGCVFLELGSPARPQLSASVAHHDREATLKLRTYASGIAERTLFFKVFASRPGHRSALADGDLAPDSEGELDQTTGVAIPRAARRVCALAGTYPLTSAAGISGCPPKFAAPDAAVKECVAELKRNPQPAQESVKPSARKPAERCAAGIVTGLQEATTWLEQRVR